MSMVTVVIAHRSESVSAGIRHGLEQHGLTVVGVARDGAHAAWLALHRRPALCVLDADVPLHDVALEQIRQSAPAVRIAILGNPIADRELMAALRAGADGYVLKSTAPDRMSAALQAIARGETSFPRDFTAYLAAEARRPPHTSLLRRAARVPLYPIRFTRHYRRRRELEMTVSESLASARRRMREYQ
jgi:DNA-binding NarL/FixJ family response regulator